GQRGFIITGDASYLEPYQSALTAIKTTFGDLKQLTLDNPNHQRRWAAMAPLIDSKLAELRETIELRRTQGFDAALKVVQSNAGKSIMDQLRSIATEADQEAQALLKQHSADARASADMTMGIILWGGLAGTLVVAMIGLLISRSLSQQIGDAVGQVRSSSTE